MAYDEKITKQKTKYITTIRLQIIESQSSTDFDLLWYFWEFLIFVIMLRQKFK